FVFARVINDYGSLAALISYLLILTVAGQAMQVATAREAVLGHLGVGREMAATLISWTKSMLVFTAAMTVVSIALRHQIAGLIVIAVLQNIDLIAAKHRFSSHVASSYAASAVAAKVLIWVAMGAGFYLVPEVSRRRAAGEDPRGVLLLALGIIAVCAVPCLLIFLVGAHTLLAIAFSPKRATASSSLLPLGAAFTVLAATYLAVQYMLALKRTWFLLAIGAVAVLEPILLLHASHHPAGFAGVVLGVQALGALVALALALGSRPKRKPAPAVNPELA